MLYFQKLFGTPIFKTSILSTLIDLFLPREKKSHSISLVPIFLGNPADHSFQSQPNQESEGSRNSVQVWFTNLVKLWGSADGNMNQNDLISSLVQHTHTQSESNSLHEVVLLNCFVSNTLCLGKLVHVYLHFFCVAFWFCCHPHDWPEKTQFLASNYGCLSSWDSCSEIVGICNWTPCDTSTEMPPTCTFPANREPANTWSFCWWQIFNKPWWWWASS